MLASQVYKRNPEFNPSQNKLYYFDAGLERYSPLKKTENVDTNSKEHSEICFFDNQIVDWLRNHLSYNTVGYNKLQRPHGKTGGGSKETFELAEGLFSINGVPVNFFLKPLLPQATIFKGENQSPISPTLPHQFGILTKFYVGSPPPPQSPRGSFPFSFYVPPSPHLFFLQIAQVLTT